MTQETFCLVKEGYHYYHLYIFKLIFYKNNTLTVLGSAEIQAAINSSIENF